MRTTKQLSKALVAIQDEAIERIKSFFKGKPYIRIIIMPSQRLKIDTGTAIGRVTEVRSTGDVIVEIGKNHVAFSEDFGHLPADALLTILDELERMKKGKQLMKP